MRRCSPQQKLAKNMIILQYVTFATASDVDFGLLSLNLLVMTVDLGFRVPDLIPIVISFIGELAITYPIQALKNGCWEGLISDVYPPVN